MRKELSGNIFYFEGYIFFYISSIKMLIWDINSLMTKKIINNFDQWWNDGENKFKKLNSK